MQDYVYVSCDNGEPVAMRPVKWDKRKAGNPNTLVDGGRRDMAHITRPKRFRSIEDTYPVAISVMGQLWTLELSWDARCERIERNARKERMAALQAEDEEYEDYAAYYMEGMTFQL
jgi:hypothetical protein